MASAGALELDRAIGDQNLRIDCRRLADLGMRYNQTSGEYATARRYLEESLVRRAEPRQPRLYRGGPRALLGQSGRADGQTLRRPQPIWKSAQRRSWPRRAQSTAFTIWREAGASSAPPKRDYDAARALYR